MKLEDFIKEFEEILNMEAGALSLEMNLNDLDEWDSLSKIALEVFLEEEFELKVEVETLNGLKTVADIVEIVKDKLQ